MMCTNKTRQLQILKEQNHGPYSNEPIADKHWLAKYSENKNKYEQRLSMLRLRPYDTEAIDKR